MSDPEWNPPGILSIQGSEGCLGEAGLLALGLGWLGILGFFVWLDVNALCMVTPFALLGLVPLALSLYVRRNRQRYGNARFEITKDATPGGRLEGIVHVGHAIEADSHIRATLTCKQRVFGPDSTDAVISRTIAFIEPPPSTDGKTGQIPLKLDVPALAEATYPSDGDRSLYWRLDLVAERGCRGLSISFNISML